MCFGGGGGGSSGTYYANQDKLLGAQADIATGVYNDIYQPNAPAAVSALSDMATSARDGTLTANARATAGADAGAALGAGLEAADRNTARFGATINPNAVAHDETTAGLQGAAIKSGAMNQAQQWGQGQAWGRTSDLYNSLQGVPTQSSSSLASAASAFGTSGNQQQVNSNTAAGGLAKLGVAMGGGYKDGGEVKPVRGLRRRTLSPDGEELHLAAGGAVPYLPKISTGAMQPSSGPTGLSGANAAMSFAMPMAASMVGKSVVKPMLKDAGSAIKGGVRDLWRTFQEQNPGSGANMAANDTAGADAAWTDANMGNAVAPQQATEAGGLTPIVAESAAPVVADAAGTDVAATVASALAENPEFFLLKNGGPVSGKPGLRRGIARKDIKKGGPITGPGTSTSDSVPLMGSAGEFMLNAEATKMVGKDKLNAINQRGLMARRGA